MKKESNDKFTLNDKVAIITGTTRGIGKSLAEGLADAGATIIAIDRSDNNHLLEYCKKLNVTFKRIKVDLLKTSKEDLQKIVEGIVKDFSHIDILVNSAGITRRGRVEDFSEEDWLDVLKLNLTIPFYLSQIVSKYFIKQKSGKIINIASMLSFQGGIKVPSYTSSKHGVVGLTKSFAVGLGKYGINVNAIAPGFIDTDMTKPLQLDKKRNKSIVDRISLGRWGRPEDLKGALIFLASPMSNYVNGAIIPVDGGWLIG